MSFQQVSTAFPQFPDAYGYLSRRAEQETDVAVARYIFLRHGETPSNVEDKVGGQTVDVNLTAEGQSQVTLLGETLAKTKIPITAGFSSSLIRAKETPRLCLESMGFQETAVHINDSIIEKHFGKDEGETAEVYSETTKKETAETAALSWEDKFVYKVHPQDPKLESLSQVFQRGLAFLLEERAPGNYLVSTHKVVKKAQLMGLLKQSGIEVGYRSFDLKNCSVFVIEVGKDQAPKLVAATGLEVKG